MTYKAKDENAVILTDVDVATLFTLTEKSIKETKDFMASDAYNHMPEWVHENFKDKLARTQNIHSKFISYFRSVEGNTNEI